ncbi:uncharacterized protein LOC130445777 [Diorhabda sublineata]|uniref:uncharacterized protein LOC130445777 n=1 Tax=Diorhabda sublineata TaxID=1163346 RepID=UPI0024E0FCB0|nr:uncharacterized protein LOC130445777 [Diorhabda sublineata]XP_056637612.1 uncharacterized protein LOC130445777 [Diorhabda sublineata]XP_056637613.1 uncharacterized protein LOC130445777 [Diorhabda sublineata]
MDRLPNEILINILKHLNTYDLVQFCEVFPRLDYFLKEKYVIRITDWSRRFESYNKNICSFISIKMDPTLIEVLNINCLYWIPTQDLRRLLQKLVNLSELYAIDTKLGLKYQDTVEYSKLHKLAISVEDEHFGSETIEASRSLKSLRKLCIKIIAKKLEHGNAVSGLDLFFSRIKQLDELWVLDDTDSLYKVNFQRWVVQLKNLKKLVIRSRTVLPIYDFTFAGLSKTFDCKRWNTDIELIFEKIQYRKPSTTVKSIFDPRETDLEKAWDVFLSLHSDLPCGPKESKLLSIPEELNSIQFENLNFVHSIIFCNLQYVTAAYKLLESDNCKELQRLNFRTCLFQGSQKSNEQEEDHKIFKKARVGVKKDLPHHPFEKISKRLNKLVELEIYHCAMCTSSAVISAYSLIENFETLRRLTLEIPYLLDGSFLEKVFLRCRLEYLSLKLIAPNEPFVTNLNLHLEKAVALKHFRIECSILSMEKILKGLSKMPRKILQRTFIKCDQAYFIDNKNVRYIFSEFLECNPQLIFFGLIISQATAKQITDIKRTLHTFKTGHPAKIFHVRKQVGEFNGIFPVPPAHHDIIFNRTRVSVIDFDEF